MSEEFRGVTEEISGQIWQKYIDEKDEDLRWARSVQKKFGFKGSDETFGAYWRHSRSRLSN